jgi:hypothetical protein
MGIRIGDLIKHPVFREIHEKYKYIFPTAEQAKELTESKALL